MKNRDPEPGPENQKIVKGNNKEFYYFSGAEIFLILRINRKLLVFIIFSYLLLFLITFCEALMYFISFHLFF